MRISSRGKTLRALALLVALSGSLTVIGCEVDPDIDVPRQPIVPKPDTDGGDSGGDDTGDDTGSDTDPGDTDEDATDPPDGGGGACFGHCDCEPNEYCAMIGTCQLQVVGGSHFCCSRLDQCPEGEACHVEGTVEEYDVCPAAL